MHKFVKYKTYIHIVRLVLLKNDNFLIDLFKTTKSTANQIKVGTH